MGESNVRKINTKKERANYIHHLLNDIEALELMLNQNLIEKNPIRIGAEQEFFWIDKYFLPELNTEHLLKEINDEHFNTEISKFTSEINLDPIQLQNNCFTKIHQQLDSLILKASTVANKFDVKILLTGILPSLSLKDINLENMTNIKRYFALNNALKNLRKQDFTIHIKGIDEINLYHQSVMLEGCNTSFQIHLQIQPENFISDYNWAQAIAAPVLAASTNSPLLFGKELWSETRIALFTQSVDTRPNSLLLNEQQSRVFFGKEWQKGSIADIFKENIARYRSMLNSNYKVDSVKLLENNETPKLKALGLHNGTVYPWNRACYGVLDGKPNIRIENRYIPSGPSTIDEIANMAFWVGLMVGKPEKYNDIHLQWDFKDVKTNFFNASRYGLSTQLFWDGKFISSKELILNILLPIANKGLLKYNIPKIEIEKYLKIIEDRVQTQTGSQYTSKIYRKQLKKHKMFEAAQLVTSQLLEKQQSQKPVSTWQIDDQINFNVDSKIVKHIMNTDIYTVSENDSIELVAHIMKWKHIHHIPVLNAKGELLGLLTWQDLQNLQLSYKNELVSVAKVMKTNLIVTDEMETLENAKTKLLKNKIGCLPVLNNKRLVGLITKKDFGL